MPSCKTSTPLSQSRHRNKTFRVVNITVSFIPHVVSGFLSHPSTLTSLCYVVGDAFNEIWILQVHSWSHFFSNHRIVGDVLYNIVSYSHVRRIQYNELYHYILSHVWIVYESHLTCIHPWSHNLIEVHTHTCAISYITCKHLMRTQHGK